MAKKDKADEEVQAGAGPEAGSETVSEQAGEREASPLVALDDRAAAGGEGAEHAASSPGAAVESDGGVTGAISVGDGAGDGGGEDPAAGEREPGGGDDEAVDGVSGDAGGEPDAGNDGDGSADGGTPDANRVDTDGGDAGGADHNGYAPRDGDDDGAAGPTDHGDLDDGPIDFGDMPLAAAVNAYQEVLMAGAIIGAVLSGTDALDRGMSDSAYEEMGAYVRKIGRRATPAVLAQQLKILEHRETAEISEPERIALAVFISVLLDLDDFAAAERRRIEAELAPAAKERPTPIEDTIMEPVEGFFDEWKP